ncbi:transposase [Chryseobacterium oryctis]|uniref:Transposase n=1 Tax=Chryseobacterium oryctis TaxID=2952618 RepID=A0ABT3HMC3_9FLAO|nr:transposase [Chryseobacterium oryctis]MCW3160840.1 transposase [Chryseobacterium oryctis]
MLNNFKDIHIGSLIKQRVKELNVETLRICNFMKCNEHVLQEMFLQKDMNTDVLLKWSKLLEYDFFRFYTQHLILFAPPLSRNLKKNKTMLPKFRKNIYTREIIDFVLELINTGEKTKQQIIEEYRIPKTTLYKWVSKYDDK